MAALTRTAFRVFALAAVLLSFAGRPGVRFLRPQPPGPPRPALKQLLEHGVELYGQRQFAQAEQINSTGLRLAVAAHDVDTAARFANNLGMVRFASLQYAGAIDAFATARDLARSIDNRAYISVSIMNLCSLYLQVGDVNTAAASAQEALRMSKDVEVPHRALFVGILGLVESASGNSKNALRYMRSAVEMAELHESDRARFDAWNHYGQELFRAGDLDGAEFAALNTYQLGRLSGISEVRPAYLLLARIHRTRGDIALAEPLVEAGLSLHARPGDRQLWRMYFLYERALIRRAQGRNREAAFDLRSALYDAHAWREGIAPSDNLRSGTAYWLNDLYDAYVNTAMSTGAQEQAFLAVEEERAASLVQMSTTRADAPQSAAYAAELDRLRALQIAQIANPGPRDGAAIASVRKSLTEAEARVGPQVNALDIANKKPESFLSRNTLRGIQRRVKRGEALISFHLADSGSFVWALTKSSLEFHPLSARRLLVSMAGQFRAAVEQSSAQRDALGHQLYAELFGKLSRNARSKPAWILTSDDALFDIPFATLVMETKNGVPVYVVQKHGTRRIPSANMLGADAVAATNGPFVGVADGIYNTADTRWRKADIKASAYSLFSALNATNATNAAIEMPRLASSAYEIRSCASAWNCRREPVLLTGSDATRHHLSAALERRPAVIHIAAHVVYHQDHPDDALIHLGLSAGGAEVLTTKDIANLRADGALVVLSACSSAAGNSVRGAGVLGLTRAWLLAGARAVVGSRWPVPDDTGELFRSFYAHLATASNARQDFSSALQHAQLQMLQSRTWRSDPKYWGAFYLLAKE